MASIMYNDGEFIKKIVESTHPLINFDLNVVDENRLRVAGTGMYKDYIGVVLPQGCANDAVINKGHKLIIYDPLDNPICKMCKMRGLCFEEYMIIYPIKNGKRTVGSVGIGAFDSESKIRLKKMESKICTYLENLCSLITSRIKESEHLNRMEKLLNSVDETIILTDSKGEILLSNRKSQELLNNGSYCNINSIISDDKANKLLEATKDIKDMEVIVSGKLSGKRAYISCFQVDGNDSISENIFIIKYQSTITDMAYKLVTDNSYLKVDIDYIIGNSNSLLKSKHVAVHASKYNSNVLITGESGTGKELFARSIHQMSERKNKPFIALNCAAIPENLMESELFGYEDGAFTGSKQGGKPGKFELADKGTLFLDEIGDLSLHLQPKLLRAIENREIERVGGVNPIKLDIRIIAATNKDLEEMVFNREFREDLYYRLNVVPIHIPALNERVGDIMTLARFFLSKYTNKFGKQIENFNNEVEKALIRYNWPGNIRELENAIEYSVSLENTNEINITSLPPRILNYKSNHMANDSSINLKDIEQKLIIETMKKYEGNLKGKEKAAIELGISLSTLYRRLKNINSQ